MPAISFLPFLQTVPFATRVLTSLLVLGSLSAILVRGIQERNPSSEGVISYSSLGYLVLVPGASLKYPWSFLTAGFVEINIIEFLISLTTLPLASRYLERVWGARELFKFVGIVIVGSNIIAFGLSWIEFFVLGKPEYFLFGAPLRGQTALQTGFLVAFTQLIPEHQVQILGKVKLRVKTLPGIYLLASNILTLILGPNPYILIQFGFFVSWAYLRFFKVSENGEFRGDRSETFAFIYWVPPPVRKPVGYVANTIFKLCVKLRIVQNWDEPSSATSGNYAMLPGPGGSRAEAERRRALALKALDARVASAPSTSAASADVGPSTAAPAAAVELGEVKEDGVGKGKDVTA